MACNEASDSTATDTHALRSGSRCPRTAELTLVGHVLQRVVDLACHAAQMTPADFTATPAVVAALLASVRAVGERATAHPVAPSSSIPQCEP